MKQRVRPEFIFEGIVYTMFYDEESQSLGASVKPLW